MKQTTIKQKNPSTTLDLPCTVLEYALKSKMMRPLLIPWEYIGLSYHSFTLIVSPCLITLGENNDLYVEITLGMIVRGHIFGRWARLVWKTWRISVCRVTLQKWGECRWKVTLGTTLISWINYDNVMSKGVITVIQLGMFLDPFSSDTMLLQYSIFFMLCWFEVWSFP